MQLVPSFLRLLQPFSVELTAPSFKNLTTLLSGWVLAPRRTVTGAILAAGAQGAKHHSAYHRLFASARWSLEALGLILLTMILPLCGPVVFLVVDDTLAHKHGKKMFGCGMYRDPSISSRNKALKSRGHNWVILGVVLEFPFRKDHCFCLPFLFRLFRSQKLLASKGGRFHTHPELAVQMLQTVCNAHPQRQFHLLGDWAYGGQNVLKNLPANCQLTTRGIITTRPWEPAPKPTAGQKGRKRVRGAKLPAMRQRLEERCRRCTLKLYGEPRSFRIADCQGCLFDVPERLLQFVVIQPLKGDRKPQVFYSTVTDTSAEQILQWYARRWSIEVAIHDSKGQLGFEQPQGWTALAVQRTAPMLMMLYSLIVLWFAQQGHRHYRRLSRPWYRSSSGPSFADMLATLRCRSARRMIVRSTDPLRGLKKAAKTLFRLLKLAA